MKRNISLVCLFALIIALFACSRSITGTYVSVDNSDLRSITGTYVSVDNSDIYLKLDPDGTFLLEKNGKNFSGEYEVEDNIITLEFLTGSMAIKNNIVIAIKGMVKEVKIQGNTITDDKGAKWVKQKKDNREKRQLRKVSMGRSESALFFYPKIINLPIYDHKSSKIVPSVESSSENRSRW